MSDDRPGHESILITRSLPGLEEALDSVPLEWEVWVNPDSHALPREDLLHRIGGLTGLLVVGDRVDEELLSHAPSLRAVSQYGVGLDNIDLEAAKRRGVVVTNLPDEVTASTAELTITLLLACARRVVEADRWTREHNPFSWTPANLMGHSLRGKVLGLVGFGRIGQAVAGIASALGMRIIYTARTRRAEAEARLGAAYHQLADLLRLADVVSLHLPATPDTHYLIGAAELEKIKPGAILINTARGSIVDEAALTHALQTGHLYAAGLDVFEHEPRVTPALAQLDNVVLTPHIGTSTWETRRQMTVSAITALVTSLQGGNPPNRVV